MSKMRAKLVVASVIAGAGFENIRFNAVAKTSGYPADGSDDDNTYAKFSPCAEFTITIANPALLEKYKPGQKYYVDFTPAECAPAEPAAAPEPVAEPAPSV